jgi:hypothetical protein
MPNQNTIPHVDHVLPLSDYDDPCLSEIRDVLLRHNALNRFGITLLHDHFEVADDEILVESCDPVLRTLVLRPMKKAEVAGTSLLETSWSLDREQVTDGRPRPQPKPITTCRSACQQIAGKGHSSVHYPV